MDFRKEKDKDLGFPQIYGFANIIAVLGGALSFLLVFRLNWSYTHWWEARGAIGAYYAKIKDIMVMLVASYDTQESTEKLQVLRRTKVVLKMHSAAVADELSHGGSLYDPKDSALYITDKQISERWINENLDDVELADLKAAAFGSNSIKQYISTPYRVLLCHKWLTRCLNDAIAAGLVQNYEKLLAQQHVSTMLELYHAMVKIKNTNMPSAMIFLIKIMKGTYCCMLVSRV
ncbi:hypothetical protein CTAYLR_000816 [Chrysophaeum taylorii]|uniref:Uncharacterized protein n=1 Tax=Chrysophaeum taylorii TaxID=2483200 RepID=A0AAD7UQY7_9STRA|nr:hypothetical protein CTAYLR_000816 [Chrysophaeum taylorii]